jgi:hypothetical protein
MIITILWAILVYKQQKLRQTAAGIGIDIFSPKAAGDALAVLASCSISSFFALIIQCLLQKIMNRIRDLFTHFFEKHTDMLSAQ